MLRPPLVDAVHLMGDVSDPVAAAAAVMAKAEALLVEVRQARIALTSALESPERAVYLSMLETFEKGLLAALEDVVADLKTQRADIDGHVWLRRRLEGLEARRMTDAVFYPTMAQVAASMFAILGAIFAQRLSENRAGRHRAARSS